MRQSRRKAGKRSRTRKAAVPRALRDFVSERFAHVSGRAESRLACRRTGRAPARAGKPAFLQGL
jgi:hypothetical protein